MASFSRASDRRSERPWLRGSGSAIALASVMAPRRALVHASGFARGSQICLLGSIALLLGLAYVIGHGADIGISRGVKDVLSTITKPAVSVPVAFVLLTTSAWAIRHLRFEWLAWWPGHTATESA